MGYSLSWVAVRGRPPDDVLRALALRRTEAVTDVPEGDFVSAELEGGWFLVLTNLDPRFVEEATLALLSKGAELVGCFVEEHVMVSEAVAWTDGKQQWSVTHDAQAALDHLGIDGAAPKALAALEAGARANRAAEPDGPDFFFDVPVELAKAVCGFRHDEAELNFIVVESTSPPKKKGFFAGLFG